MAGSTLQFSPNATPNDDQSKDRVVRPDLETDQLLDGADVAHIERASEPQRVLAPPPITVDTDAAARDAATETEARERERQAALEALRAQLKTHPAEPQPAAAATRTSDTTLSPLPNPHPPQGRSDQSEMVVSESKLVPPPAPVDSPAEPPAPVPVAPPVPESRPVVAAGEATISRAPSPSGDPDTPLPIEVRPENAAVDRLLDREKQRLAQPGSIDQLVAMVRPLVEERRKSAVPTQPVPARRAVEPVDDGASASPAEQPAVSGGPAAYEQQIPSHVDEAEAAPEAA